MRADERVVGAVAVGGQLVHRVAAVPSLFHDAPDGGIQPRAVAAVTAVNEDGPALARGPVLARAATGSRSDQAFRRRAVPRPSRPRPSNASVPGSGTRVGVASALHVKVPVRLVPSVWKLLLERDGKVWNAYGSILFTLLVITGAIVWWPGIERWRRALGVNLRASWKRITFDLHSALGFWLMLFMLVWGVSGIYLGIPQPFLDAVDAVSDPSLEYGERWGDVALEWLPRLHFGRWRNAWLKALWAGVGLVPAVMFVTGVVMWWNRSGRVSARAGIPRPGMATRA